MSDVDDKTENDESGSEESGPIGGERLADARRKMQIPVIEIAKELHLDEYKVRALENNEFDVLGAPVFAKGHLRKYAQLVGVDEADVMTDYYRLNRSEPSPPVVKFRPVPKAEFSPAPWVAGIVAIVAAAAAYWWFVERTPAPVVEQADPVLPQVEAEPATTEQADESTVTIEDPAAAAEDTAVEAVDEEPIETAPQPAAVEVALRVTYGGDCWTEISDGRGRRLFFDLGTAGRVINVSGEPPLDILFGDADNVSLEVNGAPYTIPAANRRGQTARLTLAGS